MRVCLSACVNMSFGFCCLSHSHRPFDHSFRFVPFRPDVLILRIMNAFLYILNAFEFRLLKKKLKAIKTNSKLRIWKNHSIFKRIESNTHVCTVCTVAILHILRMDDKKHVWLRLIQNDLEIEENDKRRKQITNWRRRRKPK